MLQLRVAAFGALALLCWSASDAYATPITDPSQLGPHPTIINFESVNTGGNLVTPLPNPVTFGGVTFTSLTGSLSILDISLSGGWPTNLTAVSSKTLFPGGEPDSAISITFTKPVAQFLVGWGDPSFAGNVLRAFSASGTLLEEAAVPFSPNSTIATWVGFSRPTADIVMILVQPDQPLPSGDDYVIDNIYYNTAPVPEPSTLLLLGSGLAGLGGTAWRRHRRK